MEFQKYTGLGNDFIITDKNISEDKVIKLCNRRFGIGADGLIIAEKKNDKFFMKFYNSDGSRAKMCGNGIRCYTQYLVENKLVIDNGSLEIDTLAGIKKVEYSKVDGNFNGKLIQEDKNRFPDSINVNFVSVIDKKSIKVMTYERGAGLTLACGTGSVAAAYISNILKLTDEKINVELLGGKLFIEKINDDLYMTGLSEYIFKGSVNKD